MPQDRPSVLHEDDALYVLNKPSAMAVHRGWSAEPDVLVRWAREHYACDVVYPVGRLDRGTSGVVVFARTSELAQQLQGIMAQSDTVKRYVALVRGTPPPSGTIDYAIPRTTNGPKVPAVSHYRTLASVPTEPRHLSLVDVTIETGRLHQVRRHLKHISHPVIGDAKHGKSRLNRAIRDGYGLSRLALHALEVSFTHPATQQRLSVRAALPRNLLTPLATMGFDLCGLQEDVGFGFVEVDV